MPKPAPISTWHSISSQGWPVASAAITPSRPSASRNGPIRISRRCPSGRTMPATSTAEPLQDSAISALT